MHNETLPAKTEVILVFLIDDKIGLFKTCSELLKSNWPGCTDSLIYCKVKGQSIERLLYLWTAQLPT